MIIWDDLQSHVQNFCGDTNATTLTFLKAMMNEGYIFILADLGRSVTDKTQKFPTEADQQYYQFPVYYQRLKSAKIKTGGRSYPIEVTENEEYWDKRNIDTSTSSIPTLCKMRQGFGVAGAEIGFSPIPANTGDIDEDTDVMTTVFESLDRPMSATKVQGGSVTVTNGSATVTGAGTAFVAGMVNRYFIATSDGFGYRIVAVASTTSLTLENVFEGTTGVGASYTIAEAPQLPHEGHLLPAYFAAAHYFGGPRKDAGEEAKYWNLFYTGDPLNRSRKHSDQIVGGLIGLKHRYASDTSEQVFKSPRYRGPTPNPNLTPSLITGS